MRRSLRATRDAFADYGFVGRYFTMGALSSIINFAAFWVLYEFFDVWYLIAATLAFLVRVFFKFHSMRTWLFAKHVHGAVRKHLITFSLLEVGYLAGSLVLLATFVELVGLHPFLGLIIASAITSVCGLVLTRSIFRPESSKKGI